jgi:AcrR family transcriptional regulator
MSTYHKGEESRKEIINKARAIFNENGIQITLSTLADLLETTLGRLTYHFKNKDLLFIAIAGEYEEKLAGMRSNRKNTEISLNQFVHSFEAVMDLQYEYRCAIRYIISSLNSSDELKQHVQGTYAANRVNIRQIMEAYVSAGFLQSKLLLEENYEVFLFQFSNLFTNWVINFELYDKDKTYEELKPFYLKGIISVFFPFLTEKGKQDLSEIGLNLHL